MCAIFGMIGKTNRELLRKVSKIQIYRGPDNQGFFERPTNTLDKMRISF